MAQSTDGVRGKIGIISITIFLLLNIKFPLPGFSHGRHAWEVMWEGPLGTVAVVGIATKEASLQVNYAQLHHFLKINNL